MVPYLIKLEAEHGVDMIFMQDNCAVHTANECIAFLDETGFEVMDWPAQSPDLNPIENVWARLKTEFRKRHGPVTDRDDLINKILEIWNEFQLEYAKKQAESFTDRLKACIMKKGWQTRY